MNSPEDYNYIRITCTRVFDAFGRIVKRTWHHEVVTEGSHWFTPPEKYDEFGRLVEWVEIEKVEGGCKPKPERHINYTFNQERHRTRNEPDGLS